MEIEEQRVSGRLPRFELPEWRTRYGVVAGITGRGDEEKPFDLGLWTGEPVGEVMTRWQDLQASEPGFQRHVLGHQVHQSRVLWHDGAGPEGWSITRAVDGHATNQAGVMLYVTIADCIPVFLVDPVRRAVGLLHAGWRGTAGGILTEGIDRLINNAGSSKSDIVIHCGVGICGDCYEVGSEVVEGIGHTPDGPGPWQVDLRATLGQQAAELGVSTFSTSQWCSAHHRDRFFSHRASRGADGRMVAYLGLIP